MKDGRQRARTSEIDWCAAEHHWANVTQIYQERLPLIQARFPLSILICDHIKGRSAHKSMSESMLNLINRRRAPQHDMVIIMGAIAWPFEMLLKIASLCVCQVMSSKLVIP